MSDMFSDDYESDAPAPKPEAPKKPQPKADVPSTDFFSDETKARAKEVTQVAQAKAQATVEVVTQRAGETVAQIKARAATIAMPKFTVPKLPVKAAAIGAVVLVLLIGAGWWLTRAHAPGPSTPAPAVKPLQPAPAASEPAAPIAVAPAPVVPPVPASVAATTTPAAAPVSPPSPAGTATAIKSPTAEEISANWAKKTHVAKPAPKSAAHPQYESDADAALNAWQKNH